MPGPSSRARTRIPRLVLWFTGDTTISPLLAWVTMLRATSDMAVAIKVRSDPSKPNSSAKARPFWRAVTMSAAELMATRASFSMFQVLLGQPVEIGQPLFQIQGGPHPFQRQAQLHHRKGHVRLNANNDGLRPAQFQHVCNGP